MLCQIETEQLALCRSDAVTNLLHAFPNRKIGNSFRAKSKSDTTQSSNRQIAAQIGNQTVDRQNAENLTIVAHLSLISRHIIMVNFS